MLITYRIFSILTYPLLFIFTLLRIIKKKENLRSFFEKLLVSGSNDNNYAIWFHGASIGEVRSIFPIVKKILEKKNDIQILITSTTLTSAKVIEVEFKNEKKVTHKFLPYDIHFLANTFIRKYNPQLAIFIDSEIWPNFMISLKNKSIPVLLLNARISERSFKRWKKISQTASKIFSYFDLIVSSNKNTFENLKTFSIKNVQYLGNLKLLDLNSLKIDSKIKKIDFKNKRVWLAASTHPNEEKLIIAAHLIISKQVKDLMTIIVPRHINRINLIEKLIDKKLIKYQIINNTNEIDLESDMILINAVGTLNEFYNSCKTVFIGKSFEHNLSYNSGQNPIEPLKFGCNITHGPYVKNFEEIYDLLNKTKLATKVTSVEQLVKEVMVSINKNIVCDQNELLLLKQKAKTFENKIMILLDKYLDAI